MKKQKHTPGPWHISKDGNDVENVMDAGVCAMYADETATANAHLMAAAPDLLAALDSLLSLGASEGFGQWEEWEEVKVARAAIAKAEPK